MQGKIMRILYEKGFGFLKAESGDKEFFFHRGSVVAPTFDELHEGDRVDFTETASPKGPRAEAVSRIS